MADANQTSSTCCKCSHGRSLEVLLCICCKIPIHMTYCIMLKRLLLSSGRTSIKMHPVTVCNLCLIQTCPCFEGIYAHTCAQFMHAELRDVCPVGLVKCTHAPMHPHHMHPAPCKEPWHLALTRLLGSLTAYALVHAHHSAIGIPYTLRDDCQRRLLAYCDSQWRLCHDDYCPLGSVLTGSLPAFCPEARGPNHVLL